MGTITQWLDCGGGFIPVLTDATTALIYRSKDFILGTIASVPALLVTDGLNVTYAVDVNISQYDSSGKIDQYHRDLLHLPGDEHHDFNFRDTINYGTLLHNVPIANNNRQLVYADMGTPVILKRSASGLFIVAAFAEQQAGTYNAVPVDLDGGAIGPVQNWTTEYRTLTLGELSIFGTFGITPFEATGIFVGGVFQALLG